MNEKTLFEKIIEGKLPSHKIYEDNETIAFLDIYPAQPGHFLVVPKTKSTNLMDIDDKTLANLIIVSRRLAKHVMKKLNVNGFKLAIHNNKEGGQVILYTHVHIIPAPNNSKLDFAQMAKLLFVSGLSD